MHSSNNSQCPKTLRATQGISERVPSVAADQSTLGVITGDEMQGLWSK